MEKSGDPKKPTDSVSEGNQSDESRTGGVDVRVLSVTELVAKHYNIVEGMSYTLTLDKERKEFCFSDSGGVSQKIPIRNIQKYKTVKKGKFMTLHIWSKSTNKFHQLAFRASSTSRIITDLKAIGCYKPERVSQNSMSQSKPQPLRGIDPTFEAVNDSGGRKNSLPDNYNGAATPSQQSNQFRHSQSAPNNLQSYCPNCQGLPFNHQGQTRNGVGPLKTHGGPGNLLQTSSTEGQSAPMYILHVEHFHNNPHCQSPTSCPHNTLNPPYEPNELTDSEREVDDTEDIPLLQDHVATKYYKVAAVLGMTDVGKIKLEESQNDRTEASFKLLYKWHQQNGSKATVKKLAKVLYDAGLYDAAKLLK